MLAVEGCAALGKLLDPQDCVGHILPVIVNFSQVLLELYGFDLVMIVGLAVALLWLISFSTFLLASFDTC